MDYSLFLLHGDPSRDVQTCQALFPPAVKWDQSVLLVACSRGYFAVR